MNKGELVEAVLGADVGLASKAAAERAVNAVLDGIKKGMKKDRKVQLVGFGTFIVKKSAARKVRNPATGEMMKVKPKWGVRFKAGKELKSSL
jgi:DNA-binding protein HU-beta